MADDALQFNSPINMQNLAPVKAPAGGTPLSLSQRETEQLIQLAGWSNFEKTGAELLKSLKLSFPKDYKKVETGGGLKACRIAPDRILLYGNKPGLFEMLEKRIDAKKLALLDLSHSRWRIGVEGATSEELLARLAAIDFSLENFPVGSFVQTGIHKIGVLIERTEKTRFEILAPYTFSRSIWEYALTSAAQFGYRFE